MGVLGMVGMGVHAVIIVAALKRGLDHLPRPRLGGAQAPGAAGLPRAQAEAPRKAMPLAPPPSRTASITDEAGLPARWPRK